MEFACPGFFRDNRDVLGVDAAAGHDNDAVSRFLHQFPEQRDTLFGFWFLAGGENPLATEGNDSLEAFKRITAHVERAVKGHAHLAGRIDQFTVAPHINFPFWREGTDHHPIDPQFTGYLDIFQHDSMFQPRIEKITPPGTNNHVKLDT